MVLGYTRIGSGPTRVMATHTWLADHQTYAPMFPFIDPDRYMFVFPDFRGYGKSKAMQGEFTVREMGNDVLALADSLGWQRFHLVGNSMGGQAAQWLAGQAKANARVESLTLLCSVPASGFPLDEPTAAFFGSAVDSEEVRGQCANAVTGGRLGAGFAKYVSRMSMETATHDAIRGYLRAWTQDDMAAEVGPYLGTVAAFVGECDPVLTEAVTREKVAPLFKNFTIKTIPGAGHYPAMEVPAYTAELIAASVRGQ